MWEVGPNKTIALSAQNVKFYTMLERFQEMKTNHPILAQQIENLEINGAKTFTSNQYNHITNVIRKYDIVRKKALAGVGTLREHPLHGIVHPDQKREDYEPLVRLLRLFSIQLNKVWIEIQSIPLLANTLDSVPLEQIDELFSWILACPSWIDTIPQSRIIPGIASQQTRIKFLEFVRDVKSAKHLKMQMESVIDKGHLESAHLKNSLDLLSESTILVERHQIGALSSPDLTSQILGKEWDLAFLEKVQRYFRNLADRTRFPLPRNLNQVHKGCLTLRHLLELPRKFMAIKGERFMEFSDSVRLQHWSKESQTLLSERKKLALMFTLNDPVPAQELKNLASQLSGSGLFHRFKPSVRVAIQRYEKLLRADFLLGKSYKKSQTCKEMEKLLLSWASFLERNREFQGRDKISSVLGQQFAGIDTNFELAIEACDWGKELRLDLGANGAKDEVYEGALVDFIFKLQEADLNWIASENLKGPLAEVENYLKQNSLSDSLDLADLNSQLRIDHKELSRVQEIACQLVIPKEIQLGQLARIQTIADEFVFLNCRIEADSEIKIWLKSSFRGSDTDLNIIEQGFRYVHYLESSDLSDSMKKTFLSGNGQRRISESRTLVASAAATIATLKEIIHRLGVSTYGQVTIQGMMSEPTKTLLNRIQIVLKNPGLIQDWVDFLSCERELKDCGCSHLLSAYEERALSTWPLEDVFDYAFNASLLR